MSINFDGMYCHTDMFKGQISSFAENFVPRSGFQRIDSRLGPILDRGSIAVQDIIYGIGYQLSRIIMNVAEVAEGVFKGFAHVLGSPFLADKNLLTAVTFFDRAGSAFGKGVANTLFFPVYAYASADRHLNDMHRKALCASR